MGTSQRWSAHLAALPLLLAAAAAPLTVGAASDPEPVRLVVRPAGGESQFVELTLRAGETATVRIELGNLGREAVTADAYVADIYTLVNGGLGAHLRDERRDDAGRWLTMAAERLSLAPGEVVTRTARIRLPDDVAAGEHVSSVVLQAEASPAVGGPLSVNQVIRHAMAVVVHVPGPQRPGLEIGKASYRLVGAQASIRVAVANPGNVRLHPAGRLSLRSASGDTILDQPVEMGSFFAWTDTSLEVGLAAPLAPGAYCAELQLRDDPSDVEVAGESCFIVTEAAPPTTAAGSPPSAARPLSPLAWVWLSFGLSLGAAAAFLLLILLGGRRRRTPHHVRR